MKSWSIQAARELYCIDSWGAGYFDINKHGHVVAKLGSNQIELSEVTKEIYEAGYTLPILVRFPDILTRQVRVLCKAFELAQQQHGYSGKHTAVYPIKVNQQRCVVERISSSYAGRVGLEAGSKTELMAVLAQTLTHASVPDAAGTIVCNGYKDREYIRMALIGQKFGKRVFIVIEQLSELVMVLEEAQRLGVEPCLGVRIRLLSIGKGHWQNTGGIKSKFGLTATQLLSLIESLNASGALHCLKLLHFHMGSQIADLEHIRTGLREATSYFVQFSQLGANIEVVDVGGGVGVDYEGAQSANEFSVNYSLADYASVIVEELQRVCENYQLTPPEIITEAGRALSAHHAVLITNVVDKESRLQGEDADQLDAETGLMADFKALHHSIRSGKENLEAQILKIHELDHLLRKNFKQSDLTLKQRSDLEKISALVSNDLLEVIGEDSRYQDEKEALQQRLADKYFCNFSVFQSLPDVWGLGQVFPIIPLAGLHQEPKGRAVIHDMTCDSDGHIENYIHRDGLSKTLAVHHDIHGDTEYLLGVFMVGAYQETLGDIHNLFGDTHTINIVTDQQGYHFEEYEPGDRADELLRHVHYDTDKLLSQYKAKLEVTNLNDELKQLYLEELKAGLSGYTYLEE